MNGRIVDGNKITKCESNDICMITRWEFGNKYSSMYSCKYLHIDYSGTKKIYDDQKSKNNVTEEMKYMLSTLPEFSGNNLKLLSVYCNDNEREKICLEVLPDFIGKFVNLRELNLSKNRLSTLPSTIGNLKNLHILDLSWNCLTTLPDSIGNLKKLEELNLYSNSLYKLPDSIGNLERLEELNISNNNSLSKLPDSIGNLKKLEILNLESTNLDLLPESIENLTNLEKLSLSKNFIRYYKYSSSQYSAKYSSDWYCNFINRSFNYLSCSFRDSNDWLIINYLNLSNKKLNHIPLCVHMITNIKELDVSNNQIVKISPLLRELRLEKLYVHNNPNLDYLPDFLWKMKSLKELKIDGNLIKDLPTNAEYTLASKNNVKMNDQKLKNYTGPYIVYLK